MSFADPDPIECDMGIRVEEMTPDELVCYIKTYHQAFGLHLVVQDPGDRKIFQALQRLYGKRTAGQVVKWVFYTHKGRWEGRAVRFASFCQKRKWWTDMMHLELQDHLNRQSPPSASRVKTPGVRTVDF